ncbi:MAG TPA: diguanylate cyclase [Friedmanniella sp.]
MDQPTVPWPAPTLSGDLVGMLDRLAQTIVDALDFGVAVVNLANPDGLLEVVSVAGDEGARAALLGSTEVATRWDQMLEVSEAWGSLRFIDHRNAAATADIFSWVPDVEAGTVEDAWHPEDALFAPLVATDGSRLGVLSVDLPHDGRRPSPTTCRALEAFAVSAALAIEHATLRERAEASEARYKALATHDQLTGIANRSSIIHDIDLSSGRPERHQRMMALAFLDLDGFKQINDLHSHAAGDHVLRTVAERLASRLRPGDQVARWGGDEFLVLLRNLDSERDALHVLERLAAAVAEPILYAGEPLQLTASVGVALLEPNEESNLDDLVRSADAAMYRVKRAGRNAVSVHRAPAQVEGGGSAG